MLPAPGEQPSQKSSGQEEESQPWFQGFKRALMSFIPQSPKIAGTSTSKCQPASRQHGAHSKAAVRPAVTQGRALPV